MAVKHKVVDCIEPHQVEAQLAVLLRTLQSFNENCNLQETDRNRFCEAIVRLLGSLTIPTKPEDYLRFIMNMAEVQNKLVQQVGSNDEMIYAALKALYSAISNPHGPPQPTTSIVLQLINVSAIPLAVRWILQSGYKRESLEIVMKTLCGWLSRWTLTPNLGPIVLHFMQGLAANQHYEVLVDVTLTYIERLFNLLVVAEPRESVEPVVLHMLSSMQHSPEAFHKIIPHTYGVLTCLHKEQTESSLKCLERIINLCLALMNHFPGDTITYDELLNAIKRVSKNLNYSQRLNCNSWVSDDMFTIETQTTTGRVGLNNLGNTCYMNSVLQALFMTKMFCNDVLSMNRHMMPLFHRLQVLFAMLQHSRRSSLSPRDILDALVTLTRPPKFQQGHQHDSAEFLGYLLDVLHEQEGSAFAVRIGDGAAAGPSNSDCYQHTTTIVQRLFGGRTVAISRCGTCNNQSEHAENFRALHLPIPDNSGNQSVQTLLDYYLLPEMLCGENQYHCDTCHCLTDGERVTRVEEPPARLVLTLKHFRYDLMSQQRTKLLQHVKLDSFVHLGKGKYELYAAVVHVGSSLDSGHYYTYARNKEEWYKFNDCIVTRTTADELCSVKPPETPYILFYYKQDCVDPDPLPRSDLSANLQEILERDNTNFEMNRLKAYDIRHRRNDDPPPSGCGGFRF